MHDLRTPSDTDQGPGYKLVIFNRDRSQSKEVAIVSFPETARVFCEQVMGFPVAIGHAKSGTIQLIDQDGNVVGELMSLAR